MMPLMQALMLSLDRFLRRHRRVVLVTWAVVFIAALPFAPRQADNLTGGGFGVPGSQADAVQKAVERDFDASQRARLGVVLIAHEGATAADRQAAIDRLREAAGHTDHVDVAPQALAQAANAPAEPRTVIIPLRVDVNDWDAIDVAGDLRKELGIGTPTGAEGPVTTHLIGQAALWAGFQELSKDDLATAESVGFPIVALILLTVFGSLAAAALPLALGAVSVLVTGALIYFLRARWRCRSSPRTWPP